MRFYALICQIGAEVSLYGTNSRFLAMDCTQRGYTSSGIFIGGYILKFNPLVSFRYVEGGPRDLIVERVSARQGCVIQ